MEIYSSTCSAVAATSIATWARKRRRQAVRGATRRRNYHDAQLANLSAHRAQARAGIAAPDFSRIRRADLGRFTLDRLVGIINCLGYRVDVTVTVKRASSTARSMPGCGAGREITSCGRSGYAAALRF